MATPNKKKTVLPPTDTESGTGTESATGTESGTSAGTMVPETGNDMTDQPSNQEKTIVQFLGPYQRYSRGDLAGFGADYAQELVDRNIACWLKDFAAQTKKAIDDDYHYGI